MVGSNAATHGVLPDVPGMSYQVNYLRNGRPGQCASCQVRVRRESMKFDTSDNAKVRGDSDPHHRLLAC